MTRKLTKKIQKKLGLYPGGVWNKETASRLIQFQKKNKLKPDGIFGKRTRAKLFRQEMNETIELIKAQCRDLQVVKPEQIQYIIATAIHETDGTLEPIKERGGEGYLGSLYDPILAKSERLRNRAKKMGNREKGDGVKYSGRGFIQLTWKNNYAKYSDIIGIDLVGNPNLALEMNHSIFILVHGMKHGVFTGKKLDYYFNENGSDFISARRVVNGRDKANMIAKIAQRIRV